jgi:hypothetical protein
VSFAAYTAALGVLSMIEVKSLSSVQKTDRCDRRPWSTPKIILGEINETETGASTSNDPIQPTTTASHS